MDAKTLNVVAFRSVTSQAVAIKVAGTVSLELAYVDNGVDIYEQSLSLPPTQYRVCIGTLAR